MTKVVALINVLAFLKHLVIRCYGGLLTYLGIKSFHFPFSTHVGSSSPASGDSFPGSHG